MAKRKRKATRGGSGKGWTCPKCGRQLKVPGRHPATCTGQADVDVPVRRKAAGNGQPPAGSRHSKVQVLTPDQFLAMVEGLERASRELCGAVRALVTERDFYRRERDEAVGQLEGIRAALAGAGLKR